MHPDSHIHLDPSLQLWVLLPITLATLLMGLIRQNLHAYALREPPTTLAKIRDANQLKRASLLRRNGHRISGHQFEVRRRYFLETLHRPRAEVSSVTALMNPESLADQVMSITLTFLPHMALGTWARYSFAGVVVCRLPFSLTPKFRSMLQAGIEVAGRNLDVSYVSALSWYILNLFGNAGLLGIFADRGGGSVLVPSVASQITMNIAPDKIFEAERQAIARAFYKSHVHNPEEKVLSMNPAKFGVF